MSAAASADAPEAGPARRRSAAPSARPLDAEPAHVDERVSGSPHEAMVSA
jgi:hypothetical protein